MNGFFSSDGLSAIWQNFIISEGIKKEVSIKNFIKIFKMRDQILITTALQCLKTENGKKMIVSRKNPMFARKRPDWR